MPLDVNNNFTGNVFGRDRMGHVVPDLEFTETLRPFITNPYPAPYLPTMRQDQAHPVLAPVVLTSQELVGLDKNSAIVPAGLFCGAQANGSPQTITNIVQTTTSVTLTVPATHKFAVGEKFTISSNFTDAGATAAIIAFAGTTQTVASKSGTTIVFTAPSATIGSTAITAGTATSTLGGQYCILKYGLTDVGFAYNAITGNTVAAAGEVAVLAAPGDAAAGDVFTWPDGTTYTILSGDITTANACNLFPQGTVRPIGMTLRQVFQYIGGTIVSSATGGINFTLDGVTPLRNKVLNYKHEMGTAITTEMIVRLPWVGAAENTLQNYATNDGITGYVQSNYCRSFAHYVGATGSGAQFLAPGARIVAAKGVSAGNYTTYNSAVDDPTNVVGIVLGVKNTYPIKDFVNRVRTLYNPSRLLGPIADPNPSSLMMGGSATSGIDFIINLSTAGIFNAAFTQGTTLRPEYSTFVEVAFRSF